MIRLLLLFSFPLFGAYVGNPASPALMNTGIFSSSYPIFKFTSGYIADYISNKRYEATHTDPDFDPDEAFRSFGLHSQLASFSLIFMERLELFGTAGGSKEHAKFNNDATMAEMSSALFEFHSSYHFSWSTGAKVILLQWGQTFFSADFTYFAIPSSPKSFFKFFNRMNLPIDLNKQEFYLREWQVSGGLSSRFWFITPYGGITYLYSKLHIDAGNDVRAISYTNEENIGFFYGLTLSLTGRFHLNF